MFKKNNSKKITAISLFACIFMALLLLLCALPFLKKQNELKKESDYLIRKKDQGSVFASKNNKDFQGGAESSLEKKEQSEIFIFDISGTVSLVKEDIATVNVVVRGKNLDVKIDMNNLGTVLKEEYKNGESDYRISSSDIIKEGDFLWISLVSGLPLKEIENEVLPVESVHVGDGGGPILNE